MFGSAAVEVSFVDAVTARPVSLAGAMVNATQDGIRRSETHPRPASDNSSVFLGCCGGGAWRIQLEHAGYQPFDTTVRVRTEGRCDRPILQRARARISPTTTT